MHGKRSPARLPPRVNRGAAAWGHDESDFSVIWLSSRHSLVLPVVTRAQVHAVTDTTNQEYLAIVNAVLDEIEAGVRTRKWIAPSSLVELDAILSAICDELIYVQRKGPAHGQKLHAARSHVYPNQMSELHSLVYRLNSHAARRRGLRPLCRTMGRHRTHTSLFPIVARS